jgi:Transposase and inactivated derivatives
MTYQTFIGIDIGKYEFVACELALGKAETFPNNEQGWSAFFGAKYNLLRHALVVLETTGGYESGLLTFLVERKICVHRADTRKVKSFIRSFGQKAKTDSIDARALAQYGAERHPKLKLYVLGTTKQSTMKILEERRQDLKQMLVQEKNRLKAPLNGPVKANIEDSILSLERFIESISDQLDKLISTDEALKAKQELLKSIPGIGEVTSKSLLALIPELGHLDKKQVASLCGVAPHARQSGTRVWYSRTFGGRQNLRPILFMAAMAARKTKTPLGDFYERLVAGGKKKMVALVALMRKIIVIANAKLKAAMSPSERHNELMG